jgi:cyclase
MVRAIHHCSWPITVGGGVKTIVDIRDLFAVGADKLEINTAAIGMPDLVPDGACEFGVQCIVV